MEITGTLFKKSPPQRGIGRNGNEWSKMEFVIDFQDEMGNYKKLSLSAWGERVTLLERLELGERLNIQFDISAREYNDRWYNDVTARRIEVVGSSSPTSQPVHQTSSSTPPPASPPSSAQTSPPPTPSATSDDNNFNDDLPF